MDYGVVHESELTATRMSELYREYVEEDERKTERYLEPEERPDVDVRAGDVDGALDAEELRVRARRARRSGTVGSGDERELAGVG